MEEDQSFAVRRRHDQQRQQDGLDRWSCERSRIELVSSLRRPGFPPLYAAGFLFNTARWGLGFLAAFVANDLTSSPRAVQLTGAAMWAPMLLAGVVAGGLADRWDRRRILVVVIASLAPIVGVIAVLELRDALAVWMLYPFMVTVGLSWVADLTSRRTLVLDVVGADLIDNAMALESLSTAVGLVVGVVAGGAVVDALGAGQAFAAVGGLLIGAALLIGWSGRRAAGAQPEAVSGEGVVSGVVGNEFRYREPLAATVRNGLRLVVANRQLRSGLGVTVVANAFYFSHTPLVPLFAKQLGAGPFGAGLLASAGGLGMMAAALIVVRFEPPRGVTYVGGAVVGLIALFGLGAFGSYVPVFVSLLVAATGFGLFAATQSVVIMTSVDAEHRGRAMGLLSMAIGVLPIGMYSLGEFAEVTSPRSAVVTYASIGLLVMGVWVGRRREVLAAR